MTILCLEIGEGWKVQNKRVDVEREDFFEMDDSGPTASIIFFLLIVVIDVILFGFEAAKNSLSYKEVERKAQEDGDKKSVRLNRIINEPENFENAFQTVVMLMNLICGFVYLQMWREKIQMWLEIFIKGLLNGVLLAEPVLTTASTIITFFLLMYILLTFGVLLPKKAAVRAPEKWAYACVNTVNLVAMFLRPVTGFVSLTAKLILYLFGVRDNKDESDVTEEEIINMVQEGHEQGVIQTSEAEMISNIFEYGEKEAQDIMTNRKNVVAIDGTTLLADAIDFMLEGKHSRYPVYEENIDHIIGILHLKDALRFQARNKGTNKALSELNDLLRDPYCVPQTKNIDELFQDMQSRKLQMAIVVDEYGQTDGLVAMEDILEEIVGNIMDEYDEEQEYIEDKGNDEYIMEGKTPLEELEELFNISFDDVEFETLNGFMIYRLDRIPEPDEEFDVDYQGYNFKILAVQNKMIQSVLVTKLPEENVEEETEKEKQESKK